MSHSGGERACRAARAKAKAQSGLDPDSRAWLQALHAGGAAHEEALQRLHAFLLQAARYQLGRRAGRPQLRGEEIDDVAGEAADDALVTILAHLDEFRGASRFTTWAYRFAILEVSLALRKRGWKRRELPLDDKSWPSPAESTDGPEKELEQLELLHGLRGALDEVLTDWQREVFVAVALNGVPIDLVATRRGSSRGAVYKALHDVRRKLREHLEMNPKAAVTDSSGTGRGRSSPAPSGRA
jgi:RNA polymerase sigma-70 factor (ECF subfamily)